MEARHGFPLPVQEAVEQDIATISKFQPPSGRLLLAFEGDEAVGTACMHWIALDTCEIKRMWVDPSYRRGDVTKLGEMGLDGPFDLVLDLGCFHSLSSDGR